MFSENLLVPALVTAIAGTVRGITGFGGAMVMAPPLALLLGPQVTVPVVLLLEGLAAALQVLQTRALVHWRIVGPILAATWLFARFNERRFRQFALLLIILVSTGTLLA